VRKINHHRKIFNRLRGWFFFAIKIPTFPRGIFMVFSPDPLYNKIIKEIVLWGTKTNWEVTQ